MKLKRRSSFGFFQDAGRSSANMSFLDESDADNDGWDNIDAFDVERDVNGFDALEEPPEDYAWELEEEELDGRATEIDELSGHENRYFSWENSKDKSLNVAPYQPCVFESSGKGSTLVSKMATALGSDSREPTPSISPVQGASKDVSPNKKRRLRKKSNHEELVRRGYGEPPPILPINVVAPVSWDDIKSAKPKKKNDTNAMLGLHVQTVRYRYCGRVG